LLAGLALASTAWADSWPMKQRDMCKTGRASFTVPASRLGSTFFDVLRWQKPSGSGGILSTSMSFFDGVGPSGADLVAGGYYANSGVQGMDRHTGKHFWHGQPSGGDGISMITPAFSPDGDVIYVGSDGTPHIVGFYPTTGPGGTHWGGSDDRLTGASPTIAPDGRIFTTRWEDGPYGGTDNPPTDIALTWIRGEQTQTDSTEPALYQYPSVGLRVVVSGRTDRIKCFDGATGALVWSTSNNIGAGTDISPTIDPANGNVYCAYARGDNGNVYVVGLNRDGGALWSSVARQVYSYGANADLYGWCTTGCLSHDGGTYYVHVSTGPSVVPGNGRLLAVNTANGTLRWSFNTQSRGQETGLSCPIVTPNGVIVVGNNFGDTYYAIQDGGEEGTLLDTLAVDPSGDARASATLSADGLLYLPARMVWFVSNGDGDGPTFEVASVFSAFDLNDGAVTALPPPGRQGGIAVNHAVKLYWKPILDPTGVFDHYAIYRATSAFTDVTGKTLVANVPGVAADHYTDATAANGTHYYYGVVSVSVGGGLNPTVNSFGPRTPFVRTDLQVATLARTPAYPRYDPLYTGYWVTEPSGFGPYSFSAATGFGHGQTSETQRWPHIGDPVTYVATVRNNGTNQWFANTTGVWKRNGQVVSTQQKVVSLQPYETATAFTYTDTWTDELYPIQFALNVSDASAYNNTRTTWTKSAPFLTYIDVGYNENFREISTPRWPQAVTDNMIDWFQRFADAMNQWFADAGSPKRIHYDVLATLPDGAPLPAIDRMPYAQFPTRLPIEEWRDLRSAGQTDDIDRGMCHEMSHQLGLIDVYVYDLPYNWDFNRVSGRPFLPPNDLMLSLAPVYSPFSAGAMTSWLSIVHGYYGQFMYDIPSQVRLRILDALGQPLPGATVKMYQYCEHPDGRYISTQIKAQGVTDGSGIWTLPNVPIDPDLVPPTDAGVLHDNPFGYIAVIGTNAVAHFKVEYGDYSDYIWLSVPDTNVAYFNGQTDEATFDRQTIIGGPRQNFPPADMAEGNADDWYAYAPYATYTFTDDTSRVKVGAKSVRYDIQNPWSNYVQYPVGRSAHWDLSGVNYLRFWAYAVTPAWFANPPFPPVVRLGSGRDSYFEFTPTVDQLNNARGQWVELVIPLAGSALWDRTATGSPALSLITYFQIYANAPNDAAFSLWLDGVRFDPSPQPTPGDANCDGNVDFDDINPFVTALVSEEGYYARYPDCAYENADCNGDGAVDFDDINPFVALLVQ
jgi:hypothetical protein